MKNKRSLFLATLVGLSLVSTASSADTARGEESYKSFCSKCHGSPTKGAKMETKAAWESLFSRNAYSIRATHSRTKSKSFFNSNQFKRTSTDLKQFLQANASDS